ncbi:hypothetical protein [Cellulomonas sp. URHE0023]|uniref:hypothetical protein n=1 Tax=Cellulomonas sp. URHE0023 TaxID=1380354 RepID=UPI000489DBFA|nr:hypothetical protein [Cellulomonas sp. URHE0023]
MTRRGSVVRATTGMACALMVALAVGACSGESGDATASVPAAPSSAPAGSVSPSATPTPTPTASSVVDRSDPGLGIAFAGIPEVAGSQADAFDALMQFQVEFWRSRVEGVVSPEIDHLAVGEALAQVNEVVSTNGKNGWVTSGEETDTYTDIAGTTQLVIVDMCSDDSKVVYTQNGEVTSGADLDTPHQAIRAEVALQPTGIWSVQTYRPGDAC